MAAPVFDPIHDSIMGLVVALITYLVRWLDRKGNNVPAGRVDELEDRIDAKLDSLTQSNRHRRNEIAQLEYDIRQIQKRLDSASDA